MRSHSSSNILTIPIAPFLISYSPLFTVRLSIYQTVCAELFRIVCTLLSSFQVNIIFMGMIVNVTSLFAWFWVFSITFINARSTMSATTIPAMLGWSKRFERFHHVAGCARFHQWTLLPGEMELSGR
jgi:hypothetical protein